MFKDVVELEKTSLSTRSRRLFTLSALYSATVELLSGREEEDPQELAEIAIEYWEAVAAEFDEWQRVRAGVLSAGEVRTDFIHTHGVILQALGRLGNTLMKKHPKQWRKKLGKLRSIDWHRANSALWEGRALSGGRLSKAGRSVVLAANAIKQHFGLPLSKEDQDLEDAFNRGQT